MANAICEQVGSGSWQIFGTMLESHLVEGRQDYVPGKNAKYVYGVRRGKIRWVAVATPRAAKTKKRLAGHLKTAGLR